MAMYRSRGRGRGRSRVPKPKWVNPCGIDPVFMKHHAAYSLHEVTPLSDQELIQNILLSAKNALVHSDDFKEKFVRRTFSNPSWRDHHETWKEQRYNWLPSWKDIPKHLHDPLDSSHLQKLSVSNIYYREAAVTHFIVFTKWSVMVKSAQNYRIFVTSIQNSPTIILLFEFAD